MDSRMSQTICAMTLVVLLTRGECACPSGWLWNGSVAKCTHPIEGSPPLLYCLTLNAESFVQEVDGVDMCTANQASSGGGMGGGGLPG